MTESKEMRAFLAFSKAGNLHVGPGGISEPPPPAPDILAVVDGEQIAYEVTEALEPHYAQKLATHMKSSTLVRSVFNKLPIKMQEQIRACHGGKVISFCFKDDLSLRGRALFLPAAFEYLQNLDSNVGSKDLERFENPMQELNHVAIRHVGCDGFIGRLIPLRGGLTHNQLFTTASSTK